MNIAYTTRKVAQQLRVQITDDVAVTVQEGDLEPPHIWFALLVRGGGMVAFNVPAQEFRALCRILLLFVDDVAPEELEIVEEREPDLEFAR